MVRAAQRKGVVGNPVRTPRTARLGLAALVAGVLLLAGCGGDDGDDIEVEDAVGSAAATEEESAESGTEEPADEDAGGAAAGQDDAATGDDENAAEGDTNEASGFREHAPPAPLACAGIDEPSPGAMILFPDAGNPATLEAGPGPVTVVVEGCSDTFEANLEYEAYHGQNANPTLSGFTSGGTLGDWEAFSISETYWTPGEWTVVVFEFDAESGERVEFDEVTFTVD